jgi:hypothetical protein
VLLLVLVLILLPVPSQTELSHVVPPRPQIPSSELSNQKKKIKSSELWKI